MIQTKDARVLDPRWFEGSLFFVGLVLLTWMVI